MSGVRELDTSPDGLKAAFAQYERRCRLIMTRVFHKPGERDQKNFSEWLTSCYDNSMDKPEFLHLDPLYRVAIYLYIGPSELSLEDMKNSAELKSEKVWYDSAP